MMAFLSSPARAMIALCQLWSGLGFLIFLILLFCMVSSLFSFLRSKIDAPRKRYVLYIKIQLYSGRAVFLCCLLSWLCLYREDPFAVSHSLSNLGVIFLPGLVTYIAGHWGAVCGMAAYYRDHPTDEEAAPETKDAPEDQEQQ